jgi:hypothetical protein
MEERVEFFAQKGPWVVVKKLKVTPETSDLDVVRFLASVQETMGRKTFEFLGKAMDLEKLDAIAAECCGAEKAKDSYATKGRLSDDRMQEAIAAIKSVKTSKAINDAVTGKVARDVARVYVTRRALEFMGFQIDLDPKQIEKLNEEKGQLE